MQCRLQQADESSPHHLTPTVLTHKWSCGRFQCVKQATSYSIKLMHETQHQVCGRGPSPQTHIGWLSAARVDYPRHALLLRPQVGPRSMPSKWCSGCRGIRRSTARNQWSCIDCTVCRIDCCRPENIHCEREQKSVCVFCNNACREHMMP